MSDSPTIPRRNIAHEGKNVSPGMPVFKKKERVRWLLDEWCRKPEAKNLPYPATFVAFHFVVSHRYA
jgi:hypothetical protein